LDGTGVLSGLSLDTKKMISLIGKRRYISKPHSYVSHSIGGSIMAYEPKGWTYNPIKNPSKPYRAQMSVNRQTVSLGDWATAAEANAAYLKARAATPKLDNHAWRKKVPHEV
jgi:hypothetical protein